ncbi:MAG: CBS domain-containing protein [Gammaproteobacteria bacterium]|nr:CBS domain-containing protein [Gammaproteobacteria bacterium]
MKNWRQSIVPHSSNLASALEIMNHGRLKIGLVVDDDDVLLGVLSDGDVRRALLENFNLETPVTRVMNNTPKTALSDWTKFQIIAMMDKYDLLHMPIVSEDGQLKGLVSFQEALRKQRLENPVFIMAGGFGKRLRPLTNDCPKPMLKIGSKPILEHILNNFIEEGFYRFFISTHYLPEIIRDYFGDGEKWGVSIRYVHEDEPLGTGGALGLLPHHDINQPMFMINGDLLTSLSLRSFLEFHERQKGVATMCVREYQHQIPFGVVTSEGSKIKSMIEKPVHRFFVNAGIYLLEPALVRSCLPGTKVDMPTLLERQIHDGKVVNMFPIHEDWLDIGRIDDFSKAQIEAKSK